MTNAEIIQAFREEIERRIDAHHTHGHFCAEHEFRDVLSFISDLEKSKVSDGDGLEEEINRTYHDGSVADTSDIDHVTYENIAEHFYDLGCRRTAEKYDEIEYNRQRASGSSEIPNDLEEAAEEYRKGVCEHPMYYTYTKQCFIAGAKWQKEQYHFFNKAWTENMQAELDRNYENGKQAMKEQMMSEAIEATLDNTAYPTRLWFNTYLSEYSNNDRVRVIIIKKED